MEIDILCLNEKAEYKNEDEQKNQLCRLLNTIFSNTMPLDKKEEIIEITNISKEELDLLKNTIE